MVIDMPSIEEIQRAKESSTSIIPSHQDGMLGISNFPNLPANSGQLFGNGQVTTGTGQDTPITFNSSMAEQLLNDNEVPKPIREAYWWVFHKDNVLTFLDENTKKQKMMNYDILKLDMMATVPYYDYNFKAEFLFDILRNIYETKLDRALGTRSPDTKNERIILQSQFSELRNISDTGSSIIKEGFFKRLLGRR